MNRHYGLTTAILVAASTLCADVVVFKSGDKLTGKVISVADGKMTFNSAAAGKLTLKMEDIQTFATDEPITIKSPDGTLTQSATTAAEEAGRVTLTDGSSILLTEMAAVNPKTPKWTGSVVAGATFNRGNTHSDSASIDADAQLRRKDDRILLGAGYRYDKQRNKSTGKDNTTDDNWFLKGQYDYFVGEKSYLYGNVLYEKDRISHLDMRLTPGVGYGYQWIERADLNFSTEAGFTYVYAEYTDPDDTREHMSSRLAYHVDKTLNEYVKAFHNVEYLPSLERSDYYLVDADIGIRTKLTGNWIVEAKASLEHDAKPATGRDKTDYRYVLGLGLTF
ncbi:MAG: DUF481 domain-containing protein [Kiritimatiellae bacterium]|nr:DUF481 domain-containing protein [Kiritimatiellia bacterium]